MISLFIVQFGPCREASLPAVMATTRPLAIISRSRRAPRPLLPHLQGLSPRAHIKAFNHRNHSGNTNTKGGKKRELVFSPFHGFFLYLLIKIRNTPTATRIFFRRIVYFVNLVINFLLTCADNDCGIFVLDVNASAFPLALCAWRVPFVCALKFSALYPSSPSLA
jgi:hypothetical protein